MQNLKNIFFVRNAKADSKKINQSDFERTLHTTGLDEAFTLSKRLFEKQFLLDAFISSTAPRALTTCEVFCKQFHYPYSNIIQWEELYLASADKIMEVVLRIDDSKSQVALFAHNPGITECIQSLGLNVRIDQMPTCGILGIRAETQHWKEFSTCKKEFIYFDAPNQPYNTFSK